MTALAPDQIIAQWTWKTPAMKRMTIAICRLALARGPAGEFSAIDLSVHGADEHGGAGIAGTVFRQLADAGIISAVGAFVDGVFYQRRVRNAGGNPIGVWRLASPGLARALLAAHDVPVKNPEQMSLFAIPTPYP